MEIGTRDKSTYLTLALRIKERYKVDYLCTDKYEAYCYIQISNKQMNYIL